MAATTIAKTIIIGNTATATAAVSIIAITHYKQLQRQTRCLEETATTAFQKTARIGERWHPQKERASERETEQQQLSEHILSHYHRKT